jgi:hypothetical protein
VVQTRSPGRRGKTRGGRQGNLSGRTTDKASKGKYFNCRKPGYWAKEYRQPRKERNVPVQVNILETTERELLPILEPEEDTPSARIRLARAIIQELLDKQEQGSATDSTASTTTDDSD